MRKLLVVLVLLWSCNAYAADTKISALPAISSISTSDPMVTVDGGVTSQIAFDNVQKSITNIATSGGLTTGLLKVTTPTGALSTAASGVDYLVDGTKYVPYTGATGSVILGNFDISSRYATSNILFASNTIVNTLVSSNTLRVSDTATASIIYATNYASAPTINVGTLNYNTLNPPVSGSQTPWTSNINGGGFSLSNVNSASVNSIFASNSVVAITASSTNLVVSNTATAGIIYATQYASAPSITVGTLNYTTLNPAVSGSQTPWTSNIDGAGFSLSDVNSASVNSVFASTTSLTTYLNMVGATQPANPPANNIKLYGLTTQGHTRPLYLDDDGIPITIGRDNFVIAKNTSGSDFSTGQAVYVNGQTGNVPTVGLAKADSASTLPAIGVAMSAITNNSFGYIMKLGVLSNFNTNSFNNNDTIWVSTTTAGGFTNVRPPFPYYIQRLGTILVKGVGNGVMLVTTAPFIGGMETGTNSGTWTASGNIQVINSASANSIFASNTVVSGTASSTNLVVSNTATSSILYATNYATINTVKANAYQSADGTAGGTQTTGGLTFKNGLYTSGQSSGSVVGVFVGNGAAIATNQICWARIPTACTLTEWDLTAMATCPTLVVDVWKKTYSNFDPQASASIVGTNKPTLTAQIKNQSQSLSSWTTSLSAGDYIFFKVTNTDTATYAVVTLSYTR